MRSACGHILGAACRRQAPSTIHRGLVAFASLFLERHVTDRFRTGAVETGVERDALAAHAFGEVRSERRRAGTGCANDHDACGAGLGHARIVAD